MRMTFSRSNTKILPSPILPVLADFSIASIARSSSSDLIAASTFTLGRKSTTYSAPRYSSVWPFCRPKPFTSVTVMPCTPIADSASRTSSSLNGLMIAVTSFMVAFRWLGLPCALELVDALDRVRQQALAEVRAVGVDRFVGLVLARLEAQVEVIGSGPAQRRGELLVLRAGDHHAVGGGRGDRAREAQAVLVVERLGAQRDLPLRDEGVAEVERVAVVLAVLRAAGAVADRVLLLDGEVLEADAERIDDGPAGDEVEAFPAALDVVAVGAGDRAQLLAAVVGSGEAERLDRRGGDAELERLALVVVGRLIPAVVDAGDQADRVRGGEGAAHAGVGEGDRTEEQRARVVRVARAPDHFRAVQRGELAADDRQRTARVLQVGLRQVERVSGRAGAVGGRVDEPGVVARSDVDQSAEARLGLLGDLQTDLVQQEVVVVGIEDARRETALDVPVGVRIRSVDVPGHADTRGLENLVESRDGCGGGLRRGERWNGKRGGHGEGEDCLLHRNLP